MTNSNTYNQWLIKIINYSNWFWCRECNLYKEFGFEAKVWTEKKAFMNVDV